MSITTILELLKLGQKIVEGGAEVYGDVKQTLARHGIQADTDALNATIVDAERRKLIAEREAAG